MAILTPSEVRRWIPTLTGSSEDVTLTDLITTVSAMIARHLGYEAIDENTEPTVEASTYVLYLDGPDSEHPEALRLPRPVQSVASIYDDPDRTYGSCTLVASTEYDLDKPRGLVILKSTAGHAWSTGWRALKITASCGYAAHKVPEAILAAAGLWVAHLYRQRTQGGLRSTSAQGQSVSYVDPTMPAEVAELLAPYRLCRPGVWCG